MRTGGAGRWSRAIVAAVVLALALVGLGIGPGPVGTAQASQITKGDLTFTYTPSPTTLSGPGSVTYTYTVQNNSGSRTYYYDSIRDDRCSAISPTSATIRAGGTATFTCTTTVSVTTTSTVNFSFYYLTLFFGRTYTQASLTETVRVNNSSYHPRFDCTTPTAFNSSNVEGQPTTLYNQYQDPTGAQFITVGTATTPKAQYNALAYNPADGYLYAVTGVPAKGGDSTWLGGARLIRVDANGQVEDLGPITSTASTFNQDFGGGGVTSGVIANGVYYVSNAAGGTATIYRINLTGAPTATVVTSNPDFRVNDYTVMGGYLWGLEANSGTATTAPTMLRYDLATGTVTRFSMSTLNGQIPGGRIYGAAWTYGNGNLGFSDNSGSGVYQIQVTNPASSSPTFSLVYKISGPGSYNNDGASCGTDVQADLKVTKTATPSSPKPGGTITWNLTITNLGPGTSSGGVVKDTVPAGYTNLKVGSDYTGACTISGQTVTCLTGVLAKGASYVIPITATVPNNTTCVTNTATITGNELDPVAGNNTGSVETCPSNAIIDVTKTANTPVATGPDAAGNHTIAYSIKVTNSGTTAGSYTQLVDAPQFSPGTSIQTVTWSGGPANTAPTTVSADADGSYPIGTAAGKPIAAGATHTYTVTVVYKQNPTSTDRLVLCTPNTPGTGLFNQVGLPEEDPTKVDNGNNACANPVPAIQVAKTVRRATDTGNGVDSLSVNRGDQVVYVYAVSLPTGYTEPLKTIGLTDDKLGAISGIAAPGGYKSGDSNSNGLLDPGETWIYWSAPTAISASVDNVGTATGIGNVTASKVTGTDTAHVTALQPSIDLAKAPGTLTGPAADGGYTVTYTVTVKNTGQGSGSYGPITDTLQFDPNLVPQTATWSKGTTTGPTTTFTAAPHTFTVGAITSTPLAAGATDTYTVTVRYLPKGAPAAAICTAPNTGLYNSVALPSGQETDTSNNSACVAPPRFAVQKAVDGSAPGTTGPTQTAAHDAATGTFSTTVTYRVTVTNTGTVVYAHPAITDTATVFTGFTRTGITLNGTAVTPAADGSFTIPAATSTLAPGATTVYTVVVTASGKPTAAQWEQAKACNTAGAGTPGGGIFNRVTMSADSDGADNNDACAPIVPPTQVMHVVKQGLNCDTDQPTCPLTGAQFSLYTSDPSAPGATAVQNGITPNAANGALFDSSSLILGEYWLVETRAPDGFSLLAQPIHFRLTANGVTLLAPTSSTVTLKTGDPLTVVVNDVTPAPLPKAGGNGSWPYLLTGMALLGLALAYYFRPLGHLRLSGHRKSS